jgi:integrase
LKELFSAPMLLKQRVVLTFIYSAGLRGQEVINLKISDVDFQRKTIHIRQSKYKKDRIVPLAESMAVGLKKYLKAENPHIWLFNGKEPDGRYSVRGLSWVMRENLKKTSITKRCKPAFFAPFLCHTSAGTGSEYCNPERIAGPCRDHHYHDLSPRCTMPADKTSQSA